MPLLRFHHADTNEVIEVFDDEVLEVEPGLFELKNCKEAGYYVKENYTETRTVGISIGYRHRYPIYDSAHLSKKVADQYAQERDKEENLERFHKATFKRL